MLVPRPPLVYRIFRRGHDSAPAMRPVILAMVAVAVLLTGVGLVRVSRQHDVLRCGYELSRKSDQLRRLQELNRQLELEHGILSAPDRIGRLATRLGMTPVAPDRIRVIAPIWVSTR